MLTVDQIAVVLATNLVEQGVLGVPVEYGSERQIRTQAGARVVVGMLPRFRAEPAQGNHAVGPARLDGNRAARAVAERLQEFAVWVRGEPPPRDAPPEEHVRLAQASTAALLHQVWLGLWRLAPNVTMASDGEWLDLDSADFTYGATVQLRGSVLIPVLDVPVPLILDAQPGETTTVLVVGELEETAVVTPGVP